MIAHWLKSPTAAVLIAVPVMLACAAENHLWALTLAMAFCAVLNAAKLHIASPWRERHAQ